MTYVTWAWHDRKKCMTVLTVLNDVSSSTDCGPTTGLNLNLFLWTQLFQRLPVNHLLHHRRCTHINFSKPVPLFPQQQPLLQRQQEGVCEPKDRMDAFIFTVFSSTQQLMSSMLSTWWISQALKAGISFKAESVPCPPSELTTFLNVVFV